MAHDGYTTIVRTFDPAQGELLAEMLRREGIEARFHRVSSTLIGLPESMIEMTVDVPVEAEARARELLADLEYVGAVGEVEPEVEGAPGRDEERDEEPRPRPRRHPLLAAGFAVFLPGGAHLYARRPWTSLVIGLGEVNALAIGLTASEALLSEIATAALVALVACDAFAGVRAARAARDGQPASRGNQLARGLGLMLVAVVVGIGARAAAELPRRVRDWRAAATYTSKYKVGCTARSIVVENHSGKPREIEIAKLKVVTSTLFNRDDRAAKSVAIIGPRFLTVAAGGRAVVNVDVPDSIAVTCRFPGARRQVRVYIKGINDQMFGLGEDPIGCHFEFAFAARKLDGVDDDPFEADGFCNPSSETGGEVPGRLGARQEPPQD